MRDKAIITSALPYSNGEIHIGHIASTYLPADVTTRFLKQRGVNVYYICASDDFGTPILIKSEQENKNPKQYVDHWNKQHLNDFKAVDIKFDFFDSTSTQEHEKFVQYIFTKLYKQGHIYKSKIIQFYCKTDKKFLPDRYVIGKCPYCNSDDQYSDLCEQCGRIPKKINNPKCVLCGESPIKKETEHYFFKLNKFSSRLSIWLKNNTNLQIDVKKYVQNWIKNGLIDWDIARDIKWGISIPINNSDQVFYGWFDNHLAYISSAIKFLDKQGLDGKKFWNSADIYHFIGKDIIYHHYLFLPAIRLGINEEYKLPDYIPTRGHLKLHNKKLSKSRNWQISIKQFLAEYPADYLRFYLTLITQYSQDDLNFNWEEFATIINSELIGNIGNFINRVLKLTDSKYHLKIPTPNKFDDMDNTIMNKINQINKKFEIFMIQNNLDKGLKCILQTSALLNQYFQHKEPWKNDSNSDNCIFISLNAIANISIMLYPFLPTTAQKIWKQLNINAKMIEKNNKTNIIISGQNIEKPSILFTKIEKEQIQNNISQIKDV